MKIFHIALFATIISFFPAQGQIKKSLEQAPKKDNQTIPTTIPKSSYARQDSARQKYIPQQLEMVSMEDMDDDLRIKEDLQAKKKEEYPSAKKVEISNLGNQKNAKISTKQIEEIIIPEIFDEDDEDDGTLSESDILYASFDTSAIHYPKFDFSNKQDTTVVVLLHGKSTYVHPFKGNLTSQFGPRRRRYHYGNDIKLYVGDSVVSAFDGTIRIAKKNKTYGNLVVIRHDNGLETFYAHLSALEVLPEQRVNAGDLIGLGGNTGRSRGSHLHFEVRYLGAAINPNDIIDFNNYRLLNDTLFLTKDNFYHQKNRNSSLLASKAGGAKGTVASRKSSNYYKIRKGDTLGEIAARNGVTVSKLCKMNGIKSNKTLAVGKKLRVK